MVDAFQDFAAERPMRKKFAKPPVKVACLPWCASPSLFVDASPANTLLVALRGLVAAGKSLVPTYVPLWLIRSAFDACILNCLVCFQKPKVLVLAQQTRWAS